MTGHGGGNICADSCRGGRFARLHESRFYFIDFVASVFSESAESVPFTVTES